MSYDYWIIKLDSDLNMLSEITNENQLLPIGLTEDVKNKIEREIPTIKWDMENELRGKSIHWGGSPDYGPQFKIMFDSSEVGVKIVKVFTSSRIDFSDVVNRLAVALDASFANLQTMEIHTSHDGR